MFDNYEGLKGVSDENKDLIKSLLEKQEKVRVLKAQIEEKNEQKKQMYAHYEDLEQEKRLFQSKVNARNHEVKLKEDAIKLLEGETSRLNQDIEAKKKEIEALEQRNKVREANIATQKEKREAFKAAIHWEEDALLKWLGETSEMERDKIALIEYTDQDNGRIKTLTLTLEKLSKTSRLKDQEQKDIGTELFATRSELDRIEEEYQAAHKERQDIIGHWEKVLQQIESRNEEISELSKHMDDMRKEEKIQQEKKFEQSQCLAAEVAYGKELTKKVSEQEGNASRLRMQHSTEVQRENDLTAEIETMKNISFHLGYDVQHSRDNIREINKQIQQKQLRIFEATKAQEKRQNEIDCISQENFDTEHYSQELEMLLSSERNKLSITQEEFNCVQNAVLAISQKLKEMLAMDKDKESELKGLRASSRNLSSVIVKLEYERVKQQKLLAGINITIKHTEQRIGIMEGELENDEERWQIQKERDRLQKIHDDRNTALDFLNQQVKTMMEKITLAVKTLHSSKKLNEEFREKIGGLEFVIGNSEKALKQEQTRKRALLVEESLTKLQFGFYQSMLQKKSCNVLDLQKRKLEFEVFIKKRMAELKICKIMITTEIRKEEKHCYDMKRQLQKCADKVTKYEIKYEVTMKALGLFEVEGDPQEYMLLKVEEKKQTLLQKRDELIQKVIDKGDHLQRFRNTLLLIQEHNKKSRQVLNAPTLTDEETERIQRLENRKQSLDLELHEAFERQKDLSDTIARIETVLQETTDEISCLKREHSEKTYCVDALNKDLNEHKVKLLRVKKTNSRLGTEVFVNVDKSAAESDIRLHLLVQFWKDISERLFNAVSGNPELFEKFKTLFNEANLPLPINATSTLFLKGKPRSLTTTFGSKLRTSATSSNVSVKSKESKGTEPGSVPSVVSVGTDFSNMKVSSPSSSKTSSAKSSLSKKQLSSKKPLYKK